MTQLRMVVHIPAPMTAAVEKTVKTLGSASGVEKSGAIVPPASPRERARRWGAAPPFLQIGFHNCGKVLWNQGWWMLITT
jgi:hypothetical protein